MNSKKLSEIAAVLNLKIIRRAADFLVCSIPERNDLELTIEKNGRTVSFTIGQYGGAGNFVQIPNVKEGEELHQFNLAKSIVPEGDREYISQMYLEVQSLLSENSKQLMSIDKLTAQINSLYSKIATIEQSQQALNEQNTAALSRANTDEIVPKLNDISNELKPLKTDLLAWNRRNFRKTLVFAAIACVASSFNFIFTLSGFGRNELTPTTERTIRALPNP